MILIPWGRDQPGVARRAKNLGTAIVIDKTNLTLSSLALAIKEIETNHTYRRQAQRQARHLQGMPTLKNSIQKILSLLPPAHE